MSACCPEEVSIRIGSPLNALDWLLVLIPVMVLTNSAEAADVKSANQAVANSYLLKPADRHEIHLVIEVAQKYWLKHNVSPSLIVRAPGA